MDGMGNESPFSNTKLSCWKRIVPSHWIHFDHLEISHPTHPQRRCLPSYALVKGRPFMLYGTSVSPEWPRFLGGIERGAPLDSHDIVWVNLSFKSSKEGLLINFLNHIRSSSLGGHNFGCNESSINHVRWVMILVRDRVQVCVCPSWASDSNAIKDGNGCVIHDGATRILRKYKRQKLTNQFNQLATCSWI